MVWNYRLVDFCYESGRRVSICRVEYDVKGNVVGVCADPIRFDSFTVDQIREKTDLLIRAYDYPVIGIDNRVVLGKVAGFNFNDCRKETENCKKMLVCFDTFDEKVKCKLADVKEQETSGLFSNGYFVNEG